MSLGLIFAFTQIAYKHPFGMSLGDFAKAVGLSSGEADGVLRRLGAAAPVGVPAVEYALRLITVDPDPTDAQRLLVKLTRRGTIERMKLGIMDTPV